MGPMGLTPAVWDLFFKPQAGGRAAASARSGLGSGGGFRPAGGAPVALAPRLSGACGPSASSVQRHLGRSGLCGAGRASQAPLPALLLPLHPLPPRLGSLGPRRCRGQPPRVAAQHHPAQVPGRHPGGRQRLRPSGPGRRPSAPQVVRCGGAAVGAYLVHACVRGPPSVAAATEAVHGGVQALGCSRWHCRAAAHGVPAAGVSACSSDWRPESQDRNDRAARPARWARSTAARGCCCSCLNQWCTTAPPRWHGRPQGTLCLGV
jgi:hypothetical protein